MYTMYSLLGSYSKKQIMEAVDYRGATASKKPEHILNGIYLYFD